MKKILLLLLSLCFIQAQAQLLIPTDILPTAGSYFGVYAIDNPADIAVGDSGLNKTWNLSNVQFNADSFLVKQTLEASSTPFANLFPDAGIATKSFPNYDDSYITYNYFNDSNMTSYYLGGKGVLTQIYSDPLLQFDFPIGYNNIFTDDFCFESEGLGSTYNFCGSYSLHFDGVGTLILPYQTYSGVYRLQAKRKTVELSSPNDTTYQTTFYWYKPGIHHPLATYDIFTAPNWNDLVSGSMLTQSSANAIEEVSLNSSVNVYPNPFYQVVNVELDNSNASASFITVYSLDGKEMFSKSVSNQSDVATLNLDNLSSGIYLMTVQNGDEVRRELVMKE